MLQIKLPARRISTTYYYNINILKKKNKPNIIFPFPYKETIRKAKTGIWIDSEFKIMGGDKISLQGLKPVHIPNILNIFDA
jgi:hypothetical protein